MLLTYLFILSLYIFVSSKIALVFEMFVLYQT